MWSIPIDVPQLTFSHISTHIGTQHELAGSTFCGNPLSRLVWSLLVNECAAYAAYGPSATERPLGSIREEKEISISTQYNLNFWKRCTTRCLPSFLKPDSEIKSLTWHITGHDCNGKLKLSNQGLSVQHNNTKHEKTGFSTSKVILTWNWNRAIKDSQYNTIIQNMRKPDSQLQTW